MDSEHPDLPKGPGDPDFHGYIGEDKPIVQRHRDYESLARGHNWPRDRDNIDYDPSLDEDQEDNFKEIE